MALEADGLRSRASPPIIGMRGLLQLLAVVEQLRTAEAAQRAGGVLPCPVAHQAVSPPAPNRACAPTVAAVAADESSAPAVVTQPGAGAPARGGLVGGSGGPRWG